MHTKKTLLANSLTITLFICSMALISAGCIGSKENELKRPIGEANEISNTLTDTSNTKNDSNGNESNAGEVAGVETITLPTKNIKINNTNVEVEIANTDDNRAQGLSDRKALEEGKGMLFDFTNTNYKKPGFWMKDMLISIDMIWINNKKIIGITPNVPLPPNDKDLEIYYPPSEVTHVLEVPAGWSAKNKFKVDDIVKL